MGDSLDQYKENKEAISSVDEKILSISHETNAEEHSPEFIMQLKHEIEGKHNLSCDLLSNESLSNGCHYLSQIKVASRIMEQLQNGELIAHYKNLPISTFLSLSSSSFSPSLASSSFSLSSSSSSSSPCFSNHSSSTLQEQMENILFSSSSMVTEQKRNLKVPTDVVMSLVRSDQVHKEDTFQQWVQQQKLLQHKVLLS